MGGREFVPLNPNVIDRPLPPIQNRSESDPKYSIRCKVFEYQLAEWDRNERLYLERSAKAAAFVVLIHASLASTPLRFITKDDSPMWAHHKIMQVLDSQYFSVDATAIASLIALTTTPYIANVSFTLFVAIFEETYSTLESDGVDTHEIIKIAQLLAAFDAVPYLNAASLIYQTAYLSISNQDYDTLVTDLSIAARIHEKKNPLPLSPALATSQSLGFSHATTSKNSNMHKTQSVIHVSGPHSKGTLRSDTPSLSPGKHYCWYCGSCCRHESLKCKWKKKGHQDKATDTSKLGGAMCSHEDTIKALWTSMGWW